MSKFLETLRSWADRTQLKELDKFQMKYDMGMKVNPRDSLQFFVDGIVEYADHILLGDDAYFIKEDLGVDDEYQNLSVQLKDWWPKFDVKQQNYIKGQFKLLLMLGAIATRDEKLRNVINKYRDVDNPLEY